MPRYLVLSLGLVAAALAPGCGSSEKPYTDNSKDPDLYAQDVKQIAVDAIQRARRSREPADQLQTIVTEIEGQSANNRPVGSHQPVYTELLTAAKQLQGDCNKANGRPADLSTRLDGLKKIADKLPGQVQLGRGEEPKAKDPARD
ncbi:hypothetical protein [Urbifossiella limnaea]|uniref:Lipoprotein n=1 Tax=Urbifossiella limnaea TaxID=2528023 RepID=A0A517XPN6_9BACT|nr:hypothetical protein [Urbifossiella limnaea]QDU19471.1 hypothetical protein ETAA1_13960 [Urbifossiella limnaea]